MKVLALFLIITFPRLVFSQNAPKDSVYTEVINNLVYILHKVEPGQTLYSLVNKYECSVAEVSNVNPSLKSDVGIKAGQVLKFPMFKNGKHVSASAYWAIRKKAWASRNVPSKTPKTKTPVKEKASKGPYHDIKAGETIFSISKLYDLDISYLVEANNISDNKIKVGEKLLIDKNDIEKIVIDLEKDTEPVLVLAPIGRKVSEAGIAEVINTSNRTTKYLALHRTAKVGSNIKVTNEATGITIVAKVVANLSKKGHDENVMIKLSPYAFYKLRPKDSKMRATVEYYVPFKKKAISSK
ncbi:MAG: LysM peptidoglycan-binding domain-containing protein [Leadbetterella sp.]|nr:LysM peptidoglycan-binding domain-containing protein [Leadbetterella sp.]